MQGATKFAVGGLTAEALLASLIDVYLVHPVPFGYRREVGKCPAIQFHAFFDQFPTNAR
jgi:hypothetical protein